MWKWEKVNREFGGKESLMDERTRHRQGVEQKGKNNVQFRDQGDDAK